MNNLSNSWGKVIVIILVFLITVGLGFFIFGNKPPLISPVPLEPSFKVIYYTPTPGPITPSSTPSATPKVKATPTKVAPVKTEVAPSVTPKATATLTPTP